MYVILLLLLFILYNIVSSTVFPARLRRRNPWPCVLSTFARVDTDVALAFGGTAYCISCTIPRPGVFRWLRSWNDLKTSSPSPLPNTPAPDTDTGAAAAVVNVNAIFKLNSLAWICNIIIREGGAVEQLHIRYTAIIMVFFSLSFYVTHSVIYYILFFFLYS